jgi:hypothetical protein
LRVQVVILKLVCVPNRTAKNLNGDKLTRQPKGDLFSNIFIRQSPDLNEDTHHLSP